MASHPRTPGAARRSTRPAASSVPPAARAASGSEPDVSGDRRYHVRHVRRRLRQLQQHHRVLGPAAVRRRGRVQRLPGQCQRIRHDRRVRVSRRLDHGRVVGLAPVHRQLQRHPRAPAQRSALRLQPGQRNVLPVRQSGELHRRMRRTSTTCRRAPRSISAARSVWRVRRTAISASTRIRSWSPPSRTTGTS